jgi:hypothetical protein
VGGLVQRRLLESIGDIPPNEFEELHYEKQKGPVMVTGLKQWSLWRTRGGSSFEGRYGLQNVDQWELEA